MGPNITNQESIDKYLLKSLNKHIDSEATIYEIQIAATGNFTKNMDIATVYFSAPGESNIQTSNIVLTGNQKPRVREAMSDSNREKRGGRKLGDIDFSKIAANIAVAKEMLDEEEMDLDGVNSYTMLLNSDASKDISKFSLESKIGSEFSVRDGGKVTSEYYILKFEADADGNVGFVE